MAKIKFYGGRSKHLQIIAAFLRKRDCVTYRRQILFALPHPANQMIEITVNLVVFVIVK